jgi:hypothetical protein
MASTARISLDDSNTASRCGGVPPAPEGHCFSSTIELKSLRSRIATLSGSSFQRPKVFATNAAEDRIDRNLPESKLLEPLNMGLPEFSVNYARPKLRAEDVWWDLLEQWRNWAPSYFNVGQIIKHYLGVRQTYRDDQRRLTLLYLYWDPSNAHEFAEYDMHSRQVRDVVNRVRSSELRFFAMSHRDLWNEWRSIPYLASHAENLARRYDSLASIRSYSRADKQSVVIVSSRPAPVSETSSLRQISRHADRRISKSYYRSVSTCDSRA